MRGETKRRRGTPRARAFKCGCDFSKGAVEGRTFALGFLLFRVLHPNWLSAKLFLSSLEQFFGKLGVFFSPKMPSRRFLLVVAIKVRKAGHDAELFGERGRFERRRWFRIFVFFFF